MRNQLKVLDASANIDILLDRESNASKLPTDRLPRRCDTQQVLVLGYKNAIERRCPLQKFFIIGLRTAVFPRR